MPMSPNSAAWKKSSEILASPSMGQVLDHVLVRLVVELGLGRPLCRLIGGRRLGPVLAAGVVPKGEDVEQVRRQRPERVRAVRILEACRVAELPGLRPDWVVTEWIAGCHRNLLRSMSLARAAW